MPRISFFVNGEEKTLDVEDHKTLLWVLRNQLHLKGTKEGCGAGECGACTVLFNGKPVNACLVLAMEAEGQRITTIEGLGKPGQLHPVQTSFVKHGAIQCGFCTPGMVLSAKALLDETPHPTQEEIRLAMVGNLCRCTGYVKIVEAIQAVAEENL